MAFMMTRDGERVYYETWPVETPRAVIQILTGLGEMAWYYEEFAQEANRRGYAVWLHEYRKHGRSEAGYGAGNIFLTFAADAAQLLGTIRRENPGKKVFLVCHSLGTSIGQFAIAKEGARWDGIVMTGPSHQVIEPARFENLLAQAESAIRKEGPDAPSRDIYPEVFDGQNEEFAEENSPFSFITSDREKWDFMASLPFTSPDYSNRFYRDFLLMQAVMVDELALEAQGGNVCGAVPVLLLTGERDITSEHGTYAAVKAARLRTAGFTDVSVKTYPGLRHSILQETRRGEVADDILRWIADRT
ncbi:MAG: alpha/beta fold hydrolase [Eubacteriales bacterium]|nr:alpha/beta fold hydrolase [Eubacteriales bacterium]